MMMCWAAVVAAALAVVAYLLLRWDMRRNSAAAALRAALTLAPDEQRLADCVVVLTGASSGIGAEIAKLYAAGASPTHHVSLFLVARRVEVLHKVEKECLSHPNVSVTCHVADVSVRDQCASLVQAAHDTYGRIDTLLLSAGLGMNFEAEDLTDPAAFTSIMDVNYWGSVWTAMAALPYLKETHGRIGVISSVLGRFYSPALTAYSASKHAQFGFFGSLRCELMYRKVGVSITICCPGFVDTDMIHGSSLKGDNRPMHQHNAAGRTFNMRTKDTPDRGRAHLISAHDAAAHVVAAVRARRRESIFPLLYQWLCRWHELAPASYDNFLVNRYLPKC
eukprot:TRINITY_DN3998_c0_g1_i1.p1 TRINITY_DN3998_c0_g1~~TRINITY_DN3998_c0_g1_i1.p1  ORF type:complete len:335 (+),score=94.88 TRINITY_DN3998_c0_g1_i1:25-1029(+)